LVSVIVIYLSRPVQREEALPEVSHVSLTHRVDATILTEGLTKHYGRQVGISDLDLEVARARSTASSVRTAPARRPRSGC